MTNLQRTLSLVALGIFFQTATGGVAVAQNASPAPASSPANATPGGTGTPGSAVGGGMPIEEALLAYQGLHGGARTIAELIGKKITNSKSAAAIVLVATPADIAGVIQLRIVLAQAHFIKSRVDYLDKTVVGHEFTCAKPKAAGQGNFVGITGFNLKWFDAWFSTPADIAAMISAVASVTAQNESLSPSAGAFTDSTAAALVSDNLNGEYGAQVTVLEPSVGPPYLFDVNPNSAGPDLSGSFLQRSIDSLESSRAALQNDVANKLKDPRCNPKDDNVVKLSALVKAATDAVDAYENSLLGLPKPTKETPSQPSAGSGATKVSPQTSMTVTTMVTNATASPPPGAGALALPTLLAADLLLQRLSRLENVAPFYLLAIHALESGGTQLTKQQLFLGSRVFYSGGAGASFRLLDGYGTTICSGVAYGYRGFVRADDVGYSISSEDDVNVDKSGRIIPKLEPGAPAAACTNR